MGFADRTHTRCSSGEAEVNGETESLTVEVDDCGEGNSGPMTDTFSIETDSYSNEGR